MSLKLGHVVAELNAFAPPALAESWDNVGLLVGDPQADVARVLLCIDYTPDVAAEARDAKADLVIAYHPHQSRYFHELAVRFLANAHPRIEQRVHQVLTAILLVAAERGVSLAPASAASLGVDGVAFRPLVDGGGDARLDTDPRRPVELHAIWARDNRAPVVVRALDVIAGLA